MLAMPCAHIGNTVAMMAAMVSNMRFITVSILIVKQMLTIRDSCPFV